MTRAAATSATTGQPAARPPAPRGRGARRSRSSSSSPWPFEPTPADRGFHQLKRLLTRDPPGHGALAWMRARVLAAARPGAPGHGLCHADATRDLAEVAAGIGVPLHHAWRVVVRWPGDWELARYAWPLGLRPAASLEPRPPIDDGVELDVRGRDGARADGAAGGAP